MKARYECPHCNNGINVGDEIALVIKNDVGEKGLVFLKTELGNYNTNFSPGFSIIEGDLVKFSCPICHHNLTNKKNEQLAHFIQVDENDKRFNIIISQIFGEKCTYKAEEQQIVERFGEHWARYQNPDWMLLL